MSDNHLNNTGSSRTTSAPVPFTSAAKKKAVYNHYAPLHGQVDHTLEVELALIGKELPLGAGDAAFDSNGNEAIELLRSCIANTHDLAQSATSGDTSRHCQRLNHKRHNWKRQDQHATRPFINPSNSSDSSDDEGDPEEFPSTQPTPPASPDSTAVSNTPLPKSNSAKDFKQDESSTIQFSMTPEQLRQLLASLANTNRVQPIVRTNGVRNDGRIGDVPFNNHSPFPKKNSSAGNAGGVNGFAGSQNGVPRGPEGTKSSDDNKNRTPRIRGSKRGFKRLDELYNKSIHDFYVTDTSPSTPGKDDEWDEYVFIVRRRFDWSNKKPKTYVDIKSVELRDVLRQVLKDVSGISLREDKPTIEPHLLFNYLPQLENILSNEKEKPIDLQNQTLINHVTDLVEYVTIDYASVAKLLYPLLQHQEITFELLWALFLPNTLIYTICPGTKEPRCLKLDWGQQKEFMNRGTFFQLECHYVDFDGKSFGYAQAVIEIDEFRGARSIDSLIAFPLAYHPNEEAVREELISRGRKFGSLEGMHYKHYKGIAFYKRKQAVVRLTIDARIMVDPLTFRRINPNYPMSPVKSGGTSYPLAGTGWTDLEDSDNDVDDSDLCGGSRDQEDDDEDINFLPTSSNTAKPKSKQEGITLEEFFKNNIKNPHRSYVLGPDGKMKLVAPEADPTVGGNTAKEDLSRKHAMVPDEMTEEDLLLCSPTVLGFSFGDKVWAEFAVSFIYEIEFNPEAFNSLVLPENQKTIVRALVESHTVKEGQVCGIDDIIKGKGKGLVAVLHGRPGVGKTLTAEGIAEYLKRPLYMVGAGELGTSTHALEQQLSRILDVAHTWNAVLLLDEADVFLERRTMHDLQRNALVSIFLRLLEYFQGILFLTTNRVETFDEAFQSRIHIAVRYNDLDSKAKTVIWKTFLGMVARDELALAKYQKDSAVDKTDEDKMLPREIVSKEQLENLARRNCNGRQIKNVVRTAQALAGTMNEALSMKHLEFVLGVTEDFEHDLKGTGQLDGMMSYA